MANPKHLKIIYQGVKAWNEWRINQRGVVPDLTSADLTGAKLRKAKLSKGVLVGANLTGTDLFGAKLRKTKLNGVVLRGAQLNGADLREADLSGANVIGANLREAHLSRANLSGTNLSGADLSRANLSGANLSGADLVWANLSGADLSDADLSDTNLIRTNLSGADLNGANLSRGVCGSTIFADVELSTTKGLNTAIHSRPSTLGVDTIFKTKGRIPEKFLRGCGVPENLITYLPSLLEDGIQFYSGFISYSHADKEFAQRLHDRLQGEGIRCWLDEHQINPGDSLHPTIYEAIRVYDKVLLCCSETALQSWWVEKEFSRSIRKEEDYQAVVLVPLNLDGYLFTPNCTGWIADEIKQRLAADFTGWKEHETFESAIKKVIKALRTDGGKPPPPEPKLKPKKR